MATLLRIRLSRDPVGYWMGDEFIEGFIPDPRLTEAQRRRVTAWAKATGNGDGDEERYDPPPPSGAARQAAELADFRRTQLWSRLTRRQRDLVDHPRSVEGEPLNYPLNVSQITALTGTTADQIRYWSASGLLPHRLTRGGHRRFHAASVMYAFALAEVGPHGIASLRQVAKGEAAPLLLMLANVMREQVDRSDPHTGEAYRRAAADLVEIGRLTASPQVESE